MLSHPTQESAFKLSEYNDSSIPVIGSCILNISTKNEIHSMQFKVIDSNSPAIIGLKTSQDLNHLKRLSNINVNNDIDFCTEYADCFREIGLIKNQYKIKSNPMPSQLFMPHNVCTYKIRK